MDRNYNTKNPYFDNVNKPFKGNIQNPPLSSQYNYNSYQNKMPSLNKSEDIVSVYSSTFKTGCKNNDLTMDQIIDEIKLEQKLQNKNNENQNQLNLSNFHSSQLKSNSQVEKNKKFQNKNTKNSRVNIVDSFQQGSSLQYDSENQSESNSSYGDNKEKNQNRKNINENFDSNNSYTDSDSYSQSEEKSISIQDMNSQFKFKYDSSFPSVRKHEEILNQNDDSQMKFTLQRQAQEETVYSNILPK
ncbi:hypothetical protein PPERSA_10319 [Pseudocohnilembus persalinus]|uniref:Uncharacterized protein n=1 Tax=Pseudocohnilembus persalinus TaxID=266149 RepID=A0A0V0R0F9_PSEPJ|nr:hypothetical protein PPERSA_10319 [Pseudocohnilembus persalinus]|eukprot:KRX07931.1 hypothetical protein PPERSA_10319 [Pseudocohnilembus persalinus]